MKCLRVICNKIALIGIYKISETSNSPTTTQDHMKAARKNPALVYCNPKGK